MTKIRILAIDDDKDFLDFLHSLLMNTGCETVLSNNLKDFQRSYHELQPNIILLDMVMPDADGIEVIQWLANQGYNAKLVLLSGSNPVYSEAALKIGEARGLSNVVRLLKPVYVADLRKVLGIT
jgi:CheY-like chemotaxis protein